MTKSNPRLNADGMTEHAAQQGSRFPSPEVLEYPALALGVELIGEMEETGFKERQWLIRRDERFVQLSEILYCVAEQADGKSTHEEMAEGVTN
jgi:hypothetical protein